MKEYSGSKQKTGENSKNKNGEVAFARGGTPADLEDKLESFATKRGCKNGSWNKFKYTFAAR